MFPESASARPYSARVSLPAPACAAAGCKGFDGFPEGHGILLRFGRRQPDPAECGVDDRRFRMAFSGPTQREHRRVTTADSRVRQADGDEPLRSRRLEGGECFELIDRVLRAAHVFVQASQLFACGRKRRVDLERAAQRTQRLIAIGLAEGEAEQIVGFGEAVVDGDGPAKGIRGSRCHRRCDSRRARACTAPLVLGRRSRDIAGIRRRRLRAGPWRPARRRAVRWAGRGRVQKRRLAQVA